VLEFPHPTARAPAPCRFRTSSNQALYQLFLYDPNGIKIELNFDAAEAEGVQAEVMASDFARG